MLDELRQKLNEQKRKCSNQLPLRGPCIGTKPFGKLKISKMCQNGWQSFGPIKNKIKSWVFRKNGVFV
ncbi:hypothetical protein FD11_GL000522 [Ligilactobacillus pobuzihii E100301 = KCTC 13174]|uniref:Uncharacterized protein n=1 Tax=Ligilactobacillus pobuzihii TaxID=449659 RepID=A0A0R2LQ14_9LACO|nr:hypothetical protein FD11_GL000522 [Ligilactobacillus pobuzihii E100301 = KCTC 13174]KRO01664.1 hypothetical protein IV66_GL001986 [Ligilactobacillus pobuzihii]